MIYRSYQTGGGIGPGPADKHNPDTQADDLNNLIPASTPWNRYVHVLNIFLAYISDFFTQKAKNLNESENYEK